jgi:hypothetical protein
MASKVKLTTGTEKHVVYKKTTKRGEGKVGDIMVTHPTKNKGSYDTISLTRTSNAKTVSQGVAAEKKWHKNNPKVPKGSHKMPNGSIMKDSAHKMKTGGTTAAWTRKAGKNPTGGLNAKGVASYRKANPGSKLKLAVTTKPSKLDPDSKDAKRRKSFCSRMSGMPGPSKKPNGEPTRKTLALRKWNC